jgi:dolichyl-diphosphooligosaccharide--protein glycosyltransferase
MASAGVFGLLQIVAFFQYMNSVLTKAEFKYFLAVAGTIMVSAVILDMLAISYSGSEAGWSCLFYSLWDTGYAKIHIPIIASVSEHQPTTWFSFFFDLHILACVFPVGLWYCIKDVNDERVFIILYAISAVYFAGVMVRLMLTLTPCVCILAGGSLAAGH